MPLLLFCSPQGRGYSIPLLKFYTQMSLQQIIPKFNLVLSALNDLLIKVFPINKLSETF